MLDTKNFSTRVTSRTFDVASYLRSLGSDSGEIQMISATDFDEYRRINELIIAGERITDDIIVATGDNHKCYNNVVIAKRQILCLQWLESKQPLLLLEQVTRL